jgi:hypothetical protein
MTTLAQKIGVMNRTMEVSTKAREFANLARAIAAGRGDHANVQNIVRKNRGLMGSLVARIVDSDQRVYSMPSDLVLRQKAAVAAGATDSSTWGDQLAAYQTLAAAFLESLRNFGAFDRMLPSMRQVPFRTRIGASTTGIVGTAVPQASVKPISKLTLSGTQIDEQKAVAILVLTNELARFGDDAAERRGCGD